MGSEMCIRDSFTWYGKAWSLPEPENEDAGDAENEGASKGLARGIEAPSKGLARGIEAPSKPVSVSVSVSASGSESASAPGAVSESGSTSRDSRGAHAGSDFSNATGTTGDGTTGDGPGDGMNRERERLNLLNAGTPPRRWNKAPARIKAIGLRVSKLDPTVANEEFEEVYGYQWNR